MNGHTLINCYSKGNISGTSNIGAVVGSDSASSENENIIVNNLYYLNTSSLKAIGNKENSVEKKITDIDADYGSLEEFLSSLENQ